GQLECDRVGAPRVHVMDIVMRAAAILDRVVVAPARKETAVARELPDRELSAPLFNSLNFAADAGWGHRRDVHIIAFLKGDVRAARRRDDLVCRGEAQVFSFVAAVRIDRHERGAAATTARAGALVDPIDATLRSD